jgi:predicted enzyme related to lactoylglutathione lyase
MRFLRVTLVACLVAVATVASAQDGIHVRSIRVLATDPEALATFYEKAFGMSETRRPLDTARTKEIAINSGATPDIARKATTTPIIIYTRPANSPAGAMAALILEVPNLEKAIESVKANGGTQMRPAAKSGEGLNYVFVKDPDGNQIEMVEATK